MRGYELRDGVLVSINYREVKYGALVTIAPYYIKDGKRFQRCRCSCGSEQEYTLDQLQQGKSDCGKCGLSPKDKRNKTMKARGFGVAVKQYPEYIPWANMHKRCYDVNHPAYKNYGGRGITVCDRWNAKTNKRGVGFLNFMEDVGRRPSPDLTLERIETDRNYEPGNCCWATDEEQNNNRRNTIYVEINGITLSVGQWSRKTGIPYNILWKRFRTGWDKQAAITTPAKRGNRKR